MKPTIEVWHFVSDDPALTAALFAGNPERIRAAWQDKIYVKVAECVTDDLELAYRWTNNIDNRWSFDPNPVALPVFDPGRPKTPHRSSAVGDVFVRRGKPFYVDAVGFKDLD